MVPRLSIEGTVGATAQIQYCTNLSQPNWVALTNLLVQETNYSFVDVGSPSAPGRFYRVIRFSPEGMVLIPAGSFVMGDSDGSLFALPLHTVKVNAFFMDQHEVTKSLWNAVKSWNAGNGYGYENPGSGKANTHPVQSVNWRDCVKWCNARSEKEGRTPCYYNEVGLTTVYKIGTGIPYVKWDANGYRLPTEAEWERAARGGADGQRFPWGNTISWSHANYFATPASLGAGYAYDVSSAAGYCPIFEDGVNPFTGPVGYFAGNGYGLYDMAGNVWEWCWDFYGSYSSGSQTDPRGPVSGSERVYRGGGWGSGAALCRTAARYSSAPASTYNTIGFRCVMPSGQ
jgi:formylglycine-generating enzyme required for sulfatase activity